MTQTNISKKDTATLPEHIRKEIEKKTQPKTVRK